MGPPAVSIIAPQTVSGTIVDPIGKFYFVFVKFLLFSYSVRLLCANCGFSKNTHCAIFNLQIATLRCACFSYIHMHRCLRSFETEALKAEIKEHILYCCRYLNQRTPVPKLRCEILPLLTFRRTTFILHTYQVNIDHYI